LPRVVDPAGASHVTTLPAPVTAIISNGRTRQNDRTAANPHILTDPNRAPELDTRPANGRVAWVVRRISDRRADLCPRANSHCNDINDHAIGN
jgi:hypothetical protein